MKATLPLIALATALSLSACSKKADEPEATATGTPAATEAVTETEATAEPTASASEPAPSPTPTATAVAGEIPAAILGRWGMVPKDCTSTLGDAKGLIVVSPKQIKFYEAVAKLGTVKKVTDQSISGAFAFSGEGQAWKLDVTLDVKDGGKTLIRHDYGPDALLGPQKYTRCS